MATKKKKEVVNIVEEESEEKVEKYGRDADGRIIAVEDKGDPEERAKKYRIFACLLWALAIIVEVLAILRLKGILQWFPNMSITTLLIIAIVLVLLLFIPGSLLWKKANHIDPISEANKTKFWFWNNLGTVLSVLAFLPMIIFVLTDKNLDKKQKTTVGAIAAVALVLAGAGSYDYNPISAEQLAAAEAEVAAVSESGLVYWAPTSKKYHVRSDCPAFSQSETIYEGTVAQAFEKGLTDPCRRCIPALDEE